MCAGGVEVVFVAFEVCFFSLLVFLIEEKGLNVDAIDGQLIHPSLQTRDRGKTSQSLV